MNQLQGAGTRSLAWLRGSWERGRIIPGCPGADVALSHRILLGKVQGPTASIRAAIKGLSVLTHAW